MAADVREEPLFLTLRRAEEVFGLPVKTLRNLIAAGKLPSYRPTTRVLVNTAELKELIEANGNKAQDGNDAG